jgi:ADP-ribosylglycohydrolase
MKNTLILKSVLLAAVASLFSGCAAATRTVTDVGLGAGGAAIGSALTHNNPYAIAGGAAGGVLLGETLNYANGKQNGEAYQTGYDKGRSDAVKQQYWVLVNQQRRRNSAPENVSLYAIPVPEQNIDGVILNPTTKYLRIEN